MRSSTYLMMALIIAATLDVHADDEDVSFDREVAVGRDGVVKELDPGPLHLLRQAGTVYVTVIEFPGKDGRLRFRTLERASAPFTIFMTGPDGTLVWRYDGNFDTPMFLWTPTLNVKHVTIVITSAAAANTLSLSLDRVAFRKVKFFPKTLFANKLVRITDLDQATQRLGRSVVLLRLAAGDATYPCTGVLLGTAYVLTNEHCITSEEVRASAELHLDYDGRAPVRLVRLRRIVASDHDLDFAICETETITGQPTLLLRSADASFGQHLRLVGHPEGDVKQVSVEQCEVTITPVRGRGSDASRLTDFAHTCDAADGDSGAPAFDVDGRIAGIHHMSVGRRTGIRANRAVRIDEIIQCLREFFPSVAAEVVATNVSAGISAAPHVSP